MNTKILEIAQDVLAIGYPLDSNDSHISTGVISGKHEHYLQINGSINSGNSGGPLFDSNAVCIGINAASFETSEGITLAIGLQYNANVKALLGSESVGSLPTPLLGILTKRLIDSYAATQLKDENIKGVLVDTVHKENVFGTK